MRIRSAIALLAPSVCQRSGVYQLFKGTDVLSLDGTATIYVNSSVAALNAFSRCVVRHRPGSRADRIARCARCSPRRTPTSRARDPVASQQPALRPRAARCRDHIEQLTETPPFAWSTYSFKRDGDLYYYKQTVGAAAGKRWVMSDGTGTNSSHSAYTCQSKIAYHNAGPGNPSRGNIPVIRSSRSANVSGTPLMLDARMETQSILYRTLALFGVTFVVVAVLFVLVIWWVIRRGLKPKRGDMTRSNDEFEAKPAVLPVRPLRESGGLGRAQLRVVCSCRPHIPCRRSSWSTKRATRNAVIATSSRRDFGRKKIIAFGEVMNVDEMPALVATTYEEVSGALAYRLHGDGLHIVALATDVLWQRSESADTSSLKPNSSPGSSPSHGSSSPSRTTTRRRCTGFQRRGYRLSGVRPGVCSRTRWEPKPDLRYSGARRSAPGEVARRHIVVSHRSRVG